MSEKMADSISKLISKTNTFEKVESWLKGITLLMFIAGTASVYNSYKLYTLNKSIQNKEDKLNKKLDKIIETNEKIILLLEYNQNNQYNQDKNNENDITEFDNMETSCSIDSDNIVYHENEIEHQIEDYYEFVMNS